MKQITQGILILSSLFSLSANIANYNKAIEPPVIVQAARPQPPVPTTRPKTESGGTNLSPAVIAKVKANQALIRKYRKQEQKHYDNVLRTVEVMNRDADKAIAEVKASVKEPVFIGEAQAPYNERFFTPQLEQPVLPQVPKPQLTKPTPVPTVIPKDNLPPLTVPIYIDQQTASVGTTDENNN
jgi:hypothetical protein